MSLERPRAKVGKDVTLVRTDDGYTLTLGKITLPKLRHDHLTLVVHVCQELSRTEYEDDDPAVEDLAKLAAEVCEVEVLRAAPAPPAVTASSPQLPPDR